MSSADLGRYSQTNLEGTITSIHVMTLREWLTKAKKNPISDALAQEKFTRTDRKTGKVTCNLDDEHLIIVGECGGSAIDGFYKLPKVQGYQKSNLKKLIDKNGLPLVKLPKEADRWLGKKLAVRVDGNGFLRWAV